jgi:hypothetical protein
MICESEGLWHNRGFTLEEASWVDSGKSRISSVEVADVPVQIWTKDLSNTDHSSADIYQQAGYYRREQALHAANNLHSRTSEMSQIQQHHLSCNQAESANNWNKRVKPASGYRHSQATLHIHELSFESYTALHARVKARGSVQILLRFTTVSMSATWSPLRRYEGRILHICRESAFKWSRDLQFIKKNSCLLLF